MKKTFLLFLFFSDAMFVGLKSQTTAVAGENSTVSQKSQTKKHHSKKIKKTPVPILKDSLTMPVISFDTLVFDFGKVKTGDDPVHIFNFKNTGNAPLNIYIVSGCDCTELDWTKTTVVPGETGFVKATFHTKRAEPEDHKVPLKKYIDIILKEENPKNHYPIVETVTFKVLIID